MQTSKQLTEFRQLCQANDLGKEDVWQHKQSGNWIMSRAGAEKVQGRNNILIEMELCAAAVDFAVVKATATRTVKVEGKSTAKKLQVQTLGSANTKNCQMSYYAEMAEKRAKVRAVLMLMGFYALGVYGEEEADDFARSRNEGAPTLEEEPAVATVVAEQPTPAPVVVEQPAPAPKAAPTPVEQPAVAYATSQQKQALISLLNHPLIQRSEKTKALVNINRLTEEEAPKKIAALKKLIADREVQRPVTGPTQEEKDQAEAEQKTALQELIDFVTEHDSVLPKADYRRFTDLFDSNVEKVVPAKTLRAALAEAQALVAGKPAPAAVAPAAPASATPSAPTTVGPSPTPAPLGKASEATLKRLLALLPSHHITAPERTKMLASVNTLSEERAQAAINNVERTIASRQLTAYANEHAARLGEAEHKRATDRAASLTASADDFREELGWLEALVNNKKVAA